MLFGAGLVIPDQMTHERIGHPGERYREVIPLCNVGTETIAVKISHVDYRYTASGANFFDQIGSHPRSNGHWIKVSPLYVEIPPKQKVWLNCSVAIPQEASLQGTYWSMLLIEQPAITPQENVVEPILGIRTVVRYGFLIVTHVGGEGKSAIKIIHKKLEGRKFRFHYENAGDWLVKPTIEFKVFDAEGREVHRYSMGCKRLYPSCSACGEIDLSALPAGTYHSLLWFDQKNSLSGAEYEFTLR